MDITMDKPKTIDPTIVMTIEQPLAGWAPNNNASGQIPVEGQPGQYSNSSVIDVFRQNYINHIAPGEIFAAVTDGGAHINELPLNAVAASTGDLYTTLQNGRIVKFTETATSAHYDPTSPATTANGDIIIFKDAASPAIEYVVWTWEDSSNAYLGYKTLALSGGNDTLITLTKGVPHKISIGAAGQILVTNGQYIASYVVTAGFAAGTANTTKLNIGVGWVASSLDLWGIFTTIGAYKATTYITSFSKSQCRVYLWNGSNVLPNNVYPINDNYLSRVFSFNGDLYAFTQGSDNKVRIKMFDNIKFQTLFEYPTAILGNAPLHGAVDGYRGMVHWAQNGANFHVSTIGPQGHHDVMNPSDTSGSPSAVGFIKDLTSTGLFAGSKISGTNKIVKFSSSTFYPSAVWKSRVIELPYKSTIRFLRLYFSQFGSGASITASIFKGWDAGITDILGQTITFAVKGSVQEWTFHKTITDISAFWIALTFNHVNATDTAAIVRKVEIGYDLSPQP